MKYRAGMLIALLLCALPSWSQTDSKAESEAAYTRAIEERAMRITTPLGLTNETTAARVQGIIVTHYRNLRAIHDRRDESIKNARAATEDAGAAVAAIQADAKAKLDQLHTHYLGQLAGDLNQAQIDQVKDGMTFGVLNVTWNAYMKMFPDLNDEQKAQIRQWLVEARELAMDQGSAGEKHAVFGKYKGRINNYLSRAGYDLKKAEQNLRR
ncbi:MAG TPA: DUF3826 domain-containing protein [Verrucomicrobiae bacterium]|nr:DUF3826 domain-containing protein [Verrucomicrobiae bacterium]